MIGSTPRASNQQRPKRKLTLDGSEAIQTDLSYEEIELLEYGLGELRKNNMEGALGHTDWQAGQLLQKLGRLASTIISDQLGKKKYPKKE